MVKYASTPFIYQNNPMKTLLLLLAVVLPRILCSETTPFMVSLATPLQVPSRDRVVEGLRLSLLYGDCLDFCGLDIGVASHTRRDFTGLGIGGINIVNDRLYGVQLGLINWNGNGAHIPERTSKGCQFGVVNCADAFTGLQYGYINIARNSITGAQTGLFNYTDGLDGAALGSYFIFGINIASGKVNGCQIGLLNYAQRMDFGLQLGIVNIIADGGWFPVLPIVNGRF